MIRMSIAHKIKVPTARAKQQNKSKIKDLQMRKNIGCLWIALGCCRQVDDCCWFWSSPFLLLELPSKVWTANNKLWDFLQWLDVALMRDFGYWNLMESLLQRCCSRLGGRRMKVC